MFTAISIKNTFPGDIRTWEESYFSTKDLNPYRHPFITLKEDFELVSDMDAKIEPDEYHKEWIGLYHCTDTDQHHFKAYIEHNHIVKIKEISTKEILFGGDFE